MQDAPLSETGGKRLFVKEIEDALLADDIDLAVHSAKDMSAVLPEELAIAAVLPREDPRDALVLPQGTTVVDFERALAHIGEMPTIGTGSIRRIAQLAAVLPHARFTPIRGNVDTRLRKLDAGDYEALVLAAAGLRRLGLASRISAAIPVDVCIPAPGQGIVAIEIRDDDRETRDTVSPITDREAAMSLAAERAVVAALGGGCQLPLGAIAVHGSEGLTHQGDRRVARRPARDPPDVDWISLGSGDGGSPACRRTFARRCRRDPQRRQKWGDVMKQPCVYLVGAGPGDPTLISVRGQRYLEAADVVIYDHRVHARLLRGARPDAERIDVGPAAPKPLEQDAICFLLAEKSRDGKTVVRLKWGDPFVFDSGGKEALFLHEQGVPFEVVPGIPVSIGGAAYAGIPITYPEAGDVLTIVRGHERESDITSNDEWAGLADIARPDRLLCRKATGSGDDRRAPRRTDAHRTNRPRSSTTRRFRRSEPWKAPWERSVALPMPNGRG